MSDDLPDPLAAFARDCLDRDPSAPPTPLAELLRRHPGAHDRLLDALLAGELDSSANGADATAVGAPPPSGDEPDDLLGPYRLLHELGRGGQAVVFLAEDTRLGRRVALKVLPRDRFITTEAAARFRAEALTASRLDHPAICAVYESGTDHDVAFLAMQFIEGRSLATVIAAAKQLPGAFRLTLSNTATHSETRPHASRPNTFRHGTSRPNDASRRHELLGYIEKVARALHHAHSAGIVHRDVKPGNLMVRDDGEPVVLDFGLARDQSDDSAGLTRTGDVFGTPAYMAPEQLEPGGVARSDPRTDVYALGVTLFEALCGERPYDAPTHEELFRRIREGRPRSLRRLAPSLPRDLRVVVHTAMELDPARRYPTAEVFADDLRRLRQFEPIRAEPSGPLLRGRRFVQRNPRVALSLLLLTVTAVVAIWQYAVARQAVDEYGEVFARLSDERRFDELTRRFDSELWPVTAHTDEVQDWLADANALMERLDDHAARRDALRAAALQRSDAQVFRDRLTHPAHEQWSTLVAIDDSLDAGLGSTDALTTAAGTATARQERRQQLADLIRIERGYRLGSDSEQVLHDASVRLAEDRTALREMIDSAAWLQDRSQQAATRRDDDVAEGWREVAADLAGDARFASLELAPQTDLLPLHRDTRSGLWEFIHLPSGERPTPGPDGSSLQLDDDSGIVFVLLPGGSFTMGCQNEDPAAANYDPTDRGNELFLKEVSLAPFFLARHELTQHQWRMLTGGDNPSALPSGTRAFGREVTPRHPVENIDQPTAVAVLRRSGLDLPTEAQWEYAMRAGTSTRFSTGRDPSSLAGHTNLFDQTAVEAGWTSNVPAEPWRDGWVRHAPVDAFGPNRFGLYGMLGNVSEWCRDRFGYHTVSLHRRGDGLLLVEDGWQDTNPPHALRGGSYGWGHAGARSGYRAGATGKDAYWGARAMRRLDPR